MPLRLLKNVGGFIAKMRSKMAKMRVSKVKLFAKLYPPHRNLLTISIVNKPVLWTYRKLNWIC